MYTNLTDFNNGQPYWSIVPPFFIGDRIPDTYTVGDFPRRPREINNEETKKGWAELMKKFQNPPPDIQNVHGKSIFDQQVWFNNTDGGQTFRLEVVGYGKEHVSAEIKGNILHVSGKHGQKSFNQQYAIPSPENLDLNIAVSKVEHGLLEITFPAKKQEIKTIKIL